MENNLDDLNQHLFDVIKKLKNNSNPEIDKAEKISSDDARVIAQLGRVVVEGYKTKVQAMALTDRTRNPKSMLDILKVSGVVTLPAPKKDLYQ